MSRVFNAAHGVSCFDLDGPILRDFDLGTAHDYGCLDGHGGRFDGRIGQVKLNPTDHGSDVAGSKVLAGAELLGAAQNADGIYLIDAEFLSRVAALENQAQTMKAACSSTRNRKSFLNDLIT